MFSPVSRGVALTVGAMALLTLSWPVVAEPDGDGDGLTDDQDNCPLLPNPDQADAERAHFPLQITVANDAWNPWHLTAADLDGDGDADLLAATLGDVELGLSHALYWYENVDGAGTFGPADVIETSWSVPLPFAALDVDGDSDLDVVGSAWHVLTWYENIGGSGSERRMCSTSAAPRR